jgi:mannose/cellobiose epimerase-like protein (N-acyl-D-glucosamine 2-epimerase family)
LTEAAKAQAIRLKSGDPLAADRLASAVDGLYERYLSGVIPGLWNDHLTEDGKVIPAFVPASTLYHIAMSAFVTHDEMGKLKS